MPTFRLISLSGENDLLIKTARPYCHQSSPNVRHLHLGQGDRVLRADLRVAVRAFAPEAGDGLGDLFICGAIAQEPTQVKAFDREQAGIELAFRGEAGPGAGAAKRLGDGSDHTDLAAAILVAPALRDLAFVVRVVRLQRQFGVDHPDDLSGGDHIVQAPAVAMTHVHVFNEAQDITLLAEEARHRQDAGFVQAALDHHVDLDRSQTDTRGCIHSIQYFLHRKIHIVHGLEGFIVQGIEADRHTLQASCLEGRRLFGKQRPVGRQGEVEIGDLGEHLHQERQVAPYERLPTRQADFADAMPGEEARQAGDLLEGENLVAVQELMIGPKDFLGHTVYTAKITPVGDGNSQVAQGSFQGIDQRVHLYIGSKWLLVIFNIIITILYEI